MFTCIRKVRLDGKQHCTATWTSLAEEESDDIFSTFSTSKSPLHLLQANNLTIFPTANGPPHPSSARDCVRHRLAPHRRRAPDRATLAAASDGVRRPPSARPGPRLARLQHHGRDAVRGRGRRIPRRGREDVGAHAHRREHGSTNTSAARPPVRPVAREAHGRGAARWSTCSRTGCWPTCGG